MTRRAIVFLLVGPLALLAVLRFWIWDERGGFQLRELAVLPVFYAFCFMPAAILAGVDQFLADREVRFRPLVTAMFAMIPGGMLMHYPGGSGLTASALALWLAIPALICSALSSPLGRSRP